MDNLVPRLPPGCRTGRPRAYPRRVVWMFNNKIFISCSRWGAVLTEGSTSFHRFSRFFNWLFSAGPPGSRWHCQIRTRPDLEPPARQRYRGRINERPFQALPIRRRQSVGPGGPGHSPAYADARSYPLRYSVARQRPRYTRPGQGRTQRRNLLGPSASLRHSSVLLIANGVVQGVALLTAMSVVPFPTGVAPLRWPVACFRCKRVRIRSASVGAAVTPMWSMGSLTLGP